MSSPFWACGTDVVVFGEREGKYGKNGKHVFCGRLEPEFRDPRSESVHVEPLHTQRGFLDCALNRHPHWL